MSKMLSELAGGMIRCELSASGSLVITLNRAAKRNALNRDMWEGLEVALGLAADPQVGAVVLTGDGPSFCSGADLGSFGQDAEPGVFSPATRLTVSHDFMRRLHRFRKPVIAAVEGAAVGVGWSLALSTDIIVAGEGAMFSAPFLDRGFLPDGGIAWLLERSLGSHRTRQLLLARRVLDAREAQSLGLVSELVADGQALAKARAMADNFAEGPRETIELFMALTRRAGDLSYEDFLETERDSFVLNALSGNPREGVSAYLEKRKPVFRRL